MKYTKIIIMAMLMAFQLSAQSSIKAIEDEGEFTITLQDSFRSEVVNVLEQEKVLEMQDVLVITYDTVQVVRDSLTQDSIITITESRTDTIIVQPYLSKQDVALEQAKTWLAQVNQDVQRYEAQLIRYRVAKRTAEKLQKFIDNPKVKKMGEVKKNDAVIEDIVYRYKQGQSDSTVNGKYTKKQLMAALKRMARD